MAYKPHAHEHVCDCSAHRVAERRRDASLWSALVVMLACAVCPVCLSGYATLLSFLGVGWGIGLSEREHGAVLFGAVATSALVSAWRSFRTRRPWPLASALAGGALVLAGHFRDHHALEWLGMLVLMAGGLGDQLRLRVKAPAKA